MTQASITTGDGCTIACRLDGPAGAPVLVLSNSLGTAMGMWNAQMSAFVEHFRVLRYDARGHGSSAVPAGSYSIDRLGRDVLEMLDALSIDRVDFCGLSMGGMVGQWLAVRAPERVRRLVLANTSAFMGPPSAWDARIAAVRDGGMAAVTGAVLERWFTPQFRARGGPAIDAVRAMLLATDPVGYAGCCAAIRDMDQRRTSSLILAETLVIVGSLDPATPPAHGAALAAAINGANVAVLPAAHLSNIEHPDLFGRAVVDMVGHRSA